MAFVKKWFCALASERGGMRMFYLKAVLLGSGYHRGLTHLSLEEDLQVRLLECSDVVTEALRVLDRFPNDVFRKVLLCAKECLRRKEKESAANKSRLVLSTLLDVLRMEQPSMERNALLASVVLLADARGLVQTSERKRAQALHISRKAEGAAVVKIVATLPLLLDRHLQRVLDFLRDALAREPERRRLLEAAAISEAAARRRVQEAEAAAQREAEFAAFCAREFPVPSELGGCSAPAFSF